MPKHYSINYLSYHSEIKKAVFCIGHIDTYHILHDILSNTNFKEVYVLVHDELASATFSSIGKYQIIGIDYDRLMDLDLSAEDTSVICLDLIDPTFYKELSTKKIHEIILDFNWLGIESFEIWEQLRKSADHILIAKLKSQSDYKVLDWHKSESDIELSLIFPVYNVGKYIQECIDSVTAWDAPYVEFLFVNDGSPDNSEQIIAEASKKDNRIKLLNKANGGCASARQFGLERAKGKYVGFVDPDDFVDETMFKKLFTAALEHSSDIAYCGYNEFYNDTKKYKPVKDLIFAPYFNGTEIRSQIDQLIPFMRIGIWRCIFSKELLDRNNIGFYTDLRRFDDLPFKVITLLKARHVVSVPEYLYYYRLDRAGQDIKADDEKLYVHFDIFKHLDSWFENNCSDRQLDYYHIIKLDTHLWALSKIQKRLYKDYASKAKADLLTLCDKNRLILATKTYNSRKKVKQLKKILSAK